MSKKLTKIISFAAFSMIILSANSGVRAQCACYEISKGNYACCDGYETLMVAVLMQPAINA